MRSRLNHKRTLEIRSERRAEALRREGGFTLIEMLVTMIVLTVVLLGIYATWTRLEGTYAFTNDDMRAQDQARLAMGEMVEFIRTAREPGAAIAGVSVPDNLRTVIVSASPTEIVFWTDTDRQADHELEYVRFRVGGASLYRDQATPDSGWDFMSGGSVRLVTGYITNDSSTQPLFTYYDSGGDEIPASPQVATPTDIRSIQINLRIDIYEHERPIAHELTSVVQPRNMRQY